jgi:hypothetical protein
VVGHPSAPAKWTPPPSNLAKINVDAAVSRNKERCVATAFCHDCNDAYLGASAIVVRGITDIATLEALACREALALAEDLSLQWIYVASICKTMVTEIMEGSIER